MDPNNQQQQNTSQDLDGLENNINGATDLDPSQLEGFFREDGAFVQVMPDGMQLIYLPDGQMGFLLPDGSFNPLSAEFGATDFAAEQQNNQNQQEMQQIHPANNNNMMMDNSHGPSPDPNHPQQQFHNNNNNMHNNGFVYQHQPQHLETQPAPHHQMPQAPPLPPAPGLSPLFESELRFGYWPNLFIELFNSTFVRLYMCILLWNCAVILFFTGINWMFGALSRVYHPPVEEDNDWQSMGFLGILLVVSMLIATVLTMILGMIKELWRLEKLDVMFWGFTHWNNQEEQEQMAKEQQEQQEQELQNHQQNNNNTATAATPPTTTITPPWHIYAFLMIALIVLPLFWSLGKSVNEGQTAIYFPSYFSYLVHVIALVIIAIMYVWFFYLALRAKWNAYQNHQGDMMDDEDETDPKIQMRRQQEAEAQEFEGGRRWFRSPALLFELGLDAKTVQWAVFTFIFGFGGVLVVGTILATQEITPSLGAAWVVALIFFVVFLACMVWFSKRGKRISIYTNALFVFIFFVLVLVGCGYSPFEGMFALFLVPFVLLQGMMLRKREYQLRKHEVEAIFGGTVEEVVPTYDTYIVTGKQSIAALLSYFVDVKKMFGARHPQVKYADRQYRKERVSLFMDIRVLFHLWMVFWMMLAAISSMATTLPWPAISTPQSVSSSSSSSTADSTLPAFGQRLRSTTFPFCQFTAGNNSSYTVLDLAFMATLAESAGDAFQTDFENWFTKLGRPITILPNAQLQLRFPASNARQPEFIDFFDNATKTHAIVVRAAANRGGTLLRNLDTMGDSASFQLSGIFAPTVSAWPLAERRMFIRGIADVKLVASNTNVTGDIQTYLDENVFVNDGESAVIVGFGFNGAVAAIAGALSETPVVTFNAPGTSLLAEKYRINEPAAQNARRHALHVTTAQSLMGLLGEADDLGATHVLSCRRDLGGCDSITGIARTIGELCGDETYQRNLYS